MLPHQTKLLLDEVTSIPLSERNKAVRDGLQRAAEKAVVAGLAGSGVARCAQVKVHYDQVEVLGHQIWSEIKRVLQETLFESYPDCAEDILEYWQEAVDPVCEESRRGVCALLPPPHDVSQKALKDHCERVGKRIRADIKVFCATLDAMKHKKEKDRTATSNIYYLQGANSRVNINSTDSSINVVAEAELFLDLRKTLEAEIENGELKTKLTGLVGEMEKAPGTSVFRGAYAQFMELAAHHMDVIGPFLPALSQLLG
jgi:hypothetical protein